MALYLDEWMTLRNVRNADLARELECDRSLVGLWRKKKRPLTNITWINKICDVLRITQEQLSKMPPKSHDLLRNPKGAVSHSDPTAEVAAAVEGIDMADEMVGLLEEIDKLPNELIPTARKLMQRLNGLKGPRSPHPTRRGSAKV